MRISPSMAVASAALFVSLGGVGWSATGGSFILGRANTATTPTGLTADVPTTAVQFSNPSTASGATALRLSVGRGRPPMQVNSGARVTNLNVDRLDGLDSADLARLGTPATKDRSTGAVLEATNSGGANGILGRTASASASGVYGENTGEGGFGVAGRAGEGGRAVYGDNVGGGWAGFFEDNVHIGGKLFCSGCVGASDIGEKVGDADRLDGLDASQLIQGGGRAGSQALAIPAGSFQFAASAGLLGFIRISYACPHDLTRNGAIRVHNLSGSTANVFIDNGEGNPSYTSLDHDASTDLPAAAGGEWLRITAQSALGVIGMDVATVHRPARSDCHAQIQGLLTS